MIVINRADNATTHIIENKLAATVAPMHPELPECACDTVNFFTYKLLQYLSVLLEHSY